MILSEILRFAQDDEQLRQVEPLSTFRHAKRCEASRLGILCFVQTDSENQEIVRHSEKSLKGHRHSEPYFAKNLKVRSFAPLRMTDGGAGDQDDETEGAAR